MVGVVVGNKQGAKVIKLSHSIIIGGKQAGVRIGERFYNLRGLFNGVIVGNRSILLNSAQGEKRHGRKPSETNPVINPWIFKICLVHQGNTWKKQETIAFFQMIGFPVNGISPFAAGDTVEDIILDDALG